MQTAKIFTTGRSQAVRLPREFRFSEAEVFIRRDALTGDVVLSRKPSDWQGFLEAAVQSEDVDIVPRTRQRQGRTERHLFDGWKDAE